MPHTMRNIDEHLLKEGKRYARHCSSKDYDLRLDTVPHNRDSHVTEPVPLTNAWARRLPASVTRAHEPVTIIQPDALLCRTTRFSNVMYHWCDYLVADRVVLIGFHSWNLDGWEARY